MRNNVVLYNNNNVEQQDSKWNLLICQTAFDSIYSILYGKP